MDMFRRVVEALDGESTPAVRPEKQPTAEHKRLHVLLVLLRKYMQQSKQKETGLPLASLDRIIHLLRANLHYFEKMRLARVREVAKARVAGRR